MKKQQTNTPLFPEAGGIDESMITYRNLVDNSSDLFYRTDLQGRVTFVSPSIYRLTGNTVEEAIGRNMAEDGYLYPEEREIFLRELQKTGHVANFQAQMKRKDGSLWWASTNAHFLKDKQGNVIGVEGVTRDISELKQAEEALRKSEERFRLAFQTSPDAIILSRASDGTYIDMNEGFTKIWGYTREEAIGKSSLDLNIWKDPDDRKRMIDTLTESGFVENKETEFISKDGRTIIGLISAGFLTIDEDTIVLSITRNITDYKKLERQLYQANKLQALGTLAGGIAHNFNNLLMGIAGHASLLRIDLPADNGLRKRIQGIEQCVHSAADLTKQLLGLARGGKYELKAVDINGLLLHSADMFGRTRKEIQIHTRLHKERVVVKADKNQMEQMLLNLFVNAWQAMPDGGHLYLQTSITHLDRGYCRSHEIDPGRYCKLSVSDTGVGMNEQTLQCAFDPFFTTKETQCGTGLGLASAYGIAKNHGGMIDVSSEIDSGTTFTIYLPLSPEALAAERAPNEQILKGSETILVVDDEKMLLNVAKCMLERLGYRVLLCSSGSEAIELISRHGEEIDLVILDLIMPGMDGGKTFDRIRALQPKMLVILSSGYSLNDQASGIMNRGCNGFIQKPFNIAELSQKIRQIFSAVSV